MTRGFVWFPLGTVPGEGTITASARGPAKTDVGAAEPAGRDATQGRLLRGIPGRQSNRLATTPAGQPERGHGGEPERGQGSHYRFFAEGFPLMAVSGISFMVSGSTRDRT